MIQFVSEYAVANPWYAVVLLFGAVAGGFVGYFHFPPRK